MIRTRTAPDARAVPRELKRLVVAALAGRLHSTAGNVVVALSVQHWTGSFTSAGAVVGALALGQGLSAPFRGRAADRWVGPTLVACGTSYTVGLSALAALVGLGDPSRLPLAMVGALATGLMLPPVAPVLRSAVATLARDEAQVHRTLAWEASRQELIFIAGPPLALGIAALTDPATALALLALSAGAGAGLFTVVLLRQYAGHPRTGTTSILSPPDGDARARTTGAASGARTDRTAVAALALAYGLLHGALTAISLLAVRFAVGAGRPLVAGVLEATLAAGSMVGGTLVTRGLLDRLALPGRLASMALALSAVAAVCALTPSVALVAAGLLAAGFWVAPVLAAHGVAVLERADPARRAETFGWVNAAGLALNAAMTPVAGRVLDLAGPTGGAALAAVSVGLASACVWRMAPAGVGVVPAARRRSGTG